MIKVGALKRVLITVRAVDGNGLAGRASQLSVR